MKIYLAGVSPYQKQKEKVTKNARHIMQSYFSIQKMSPWRQSHFFDQTHKDLEDEMLQEIKRRIKDE